jgi:hypothetical protein
VTLSELRVWASNFCLASRYKKGGYQMNAAVLDLRITRSNRYILG